MFYYIYMFCKDAEVTSMEPRQGSLNGGTRITIKGKGIKPHSYYIFMILLRRFLHSQWTFIIGLVVCVVVESVINVKNLSIKLSIMWTNMTVAH